MSHNEDLVRILLYPLDNFSPDWAPANATPGSAGFDLRAATEYATSINPGAWRAVPTGLIFVIPRGYEMQIRPRSGLALRLGLTVLNSPGTIDSDYRGEVAVILMNHSRESITIKPGERIAQGVVQRVAKPVFLLQPAFEVPEGTLRGGGGFGSTGAA